MTEKVFTLDDIQPVELYGVNELKLQKIKGFFPKIQIVARGDLIKISGEKTELHRFEEKFLHILAHIEKYGSLSLDTIDKIMLSVDGNVFAAPDSDGIIVHGTNGKPIKPRSESQFAIVEAAKTNDLVFAIGPAGTGKTYIAVALAIRALRNKEVKRIILSRPAVEAGERLGFLPGDMKEKVDPFLQALYDALNDMLPARKLENMLEEGTIQIAPLAFMRGRTLNNAFVVLDEAQNTTLSQLKMFLTRMGDNSKFVVTGDITQIDLPRASGSGLVQAKRILGNISGIAFVHFKIDEIVRHKLVRSIVTAYEEDFHEQMYVKKQKKIAETKPTNNTRNLDKNL